MTLINANLARPLLDKLKIESKPAFITADGRRADCLGTLSLSVRHGLHEISLEKVAVVSSLPYDLILGRDWLSKSGATIDFSEGVGQLKFLKVKLDSKSSPSVIENPSHESKSISLSPNPPLEPIVEETELMDGCLAAIKLETSIAAVERAKSTVVSSVTISPDHMGFVSLSVNSFLPNSTMDVMVEKGASSLPGQEWVSPACLLTVTAERTLAIPVLNVSDNPIVFGKGEPFKLRICDKYSLVSHFPTEEFVVGSCDEIGPSKEREAAPLNSDLRESLVKDARFGNQLLDYEKSEIFDILASEPSCFPTEAGQIGLTDLVEHEIETGAAAPIHSVPYRVSAVERRTIADQVAEMEAAGVVRPSTSPWSSPVVLVKRSDGRSRFCVDYRRLNDKTRKDVYPLPRMDDVLERLGGATIFTTLDLASGYWQVPIAEKDQAKTAFVTPDGLYEFRRMPFGLCNAPATFQRLIDRALSGLKWSACLVYLDDVLVYGRDLAEHNERLRRVLRALGRAGLTLNLKKCLFASDSVKYLGHLVNAKGLSPNPEKVQDVVNFPIPKTISQLRGFLGLASFYRRFVPSFANISRPLVNLLKKGAEWKWSSAENSAFLSLKRKLTEPPVLIHFQEDEPIEVHIDASGSGLGAVLCQTFQGAKHPVTFISRHLSETESRYHANELECLALVWALDKLHPYVYGSPHFTVYSDSSALVWLKSKKKLNGKLARWVLFLADYNFDLVHVRGKRNTVADVLSRTPHGVAEETDPSEKCSYLSCLFITEREKLEEIRLNQRCDSNISPLIRQLENRKIGPITQGLARFRLREGVLYRISAGRGRPLRLVLPRSLLRQVLETSHAGPSGGHFGIFKTLERLRSRFWYPGMASRVKNFIQTCTHCQKFKVPPGKISGYLNPIPAVDSPFQVLALDHIGPLIKTKNGNAHILVIIDYLTRWVEAVAVPDVSAQHVCRFLNSVILRHGPPTKVITDIGSTFTSSEFANILGFHHIEHARTSAGHPQTNGLCERINRTIAQVLTGRVADRHNAWDSELEQAISCINRASQETTKRTPYELVYGRLPVTTEETIFPRLPGPSIKNGSSRVRKLRKEAIARTKRAQIRQANYYNRRRVPAQSFTTGDLVLVRRHLPTGGGKCSKFNPKYIGPFRIAKKIGPLTYRVENIPGTRIRKRGNAFSVHVAQLKRFMAGFQSGSSTPSKRAWDQVSFEEETDGLNRQDVASTTGGESCHPTTSPLPSVVIGFSRFGRPIRHPDWFHPARKALKRLNSQKRRHQKKKSL